MQSHFATFIKILINKIEIYFTQNKYHYILNFYLLSSLYWFRNLHFLIFNT